MSFMGVPEEEPDEPVTVAEEWAEDEKKDCLICDKVMALIGIAIAGFLFAIAMDLISGGKFSQVVDGFFARSEIEE